MKFFLLLLIIALFVAATFAASNNSTSSNTTTNITNITNGSNASAGVSSGNGTVQVNVNSATVAMASMTLLFSAVFFAALSF